MVWPVRPAWGLPGTRRKARNWRFSCTAGKGRRERPACGQPGLREFESAHVVFHASVYDVTAQVEEAYFAVLRRQQVLAVQFRLLKLRGDDAGAAPDSGQDALHPRVRGDNSQDYRAEGS